MGVAAGAEGEGEEAVGAGAAEDSAGAGAVPDGELAGEVDDGCGCDEEAGSLDRCCHLILLLNRFFIFAQPGAPSSPARRFLSGWLQGAWSDDRRGGAEESLRVVIASPPPGGGGRGGGRWGKLAR